MIQGSGLRVLSCFLDQQSHSFVQLCKEAGYAPDLGGYYIRQLMRAGYLAKGGRGEYIISPKGKQELALHYSNTKQRMASRPRLIALLVPSQDGRFVPIQRTRQPFINRVEWPAGAVNGQERMEEASLRITQSRLSMQLASPRLVGFFRRIDMFKDSLFDDKLFAVHTLEIPKDHTFSGSEIGLPFLCTEKELRNNPDRSRALVDVLEFVQSRKGGYEEHVYQLDEFDLGEPRTTSESV